MNRTQAVVRRAVLAPVRLYQRWISPARPATCKYYPSCSSYAVTAVERHGIGKGLVLAGWRLLRCNPWSDGGVDDVPAPGAWRCAPAERDHDHLSDDRLPAA